MKPKHTSGGNKDISDPPFTYQCPWCEYKGRDSEFLDGTCPACCADNFTGEVDPNLIPRVFHLTQVGRLKP